MKTLQTLQQLREMKHSLELLRTQEKKRIEMTWQRVILIYPRVRFFFELYRLFRRKKNAENKKEKNWFDRIRGWAFLMMNRFMQNQ